MIWSGLATARFVKKIRDDDYGKSFRIFLPAFSVIRRVVLPKVLCQDSRSCTRSMPCCTLAGIRPWLSNRSPRRLRKRFIRRRIAGESWSVRFLLFSDETGIIFGLLQRACRGPFSLDCGLQETPHSGRLVSGVRTCSLWGGEPPGRMEPDHPIARPHGLLAALAPDRTLSLTRRVVVL